MAETNRKIQPGRVKLAEAARNLWVVTAEVGTTQEDLMRPEYWSLMAKNFKPYDRLEVRADDGTYFAEYLIRTCDRAWAIVEELSFRFLGTQDISLTEAQSLEQKSKFKVKWNGPHLLFCVERQDGATVERLKERMSKEEAGKWLDQHLKTIGVS